MNFIIYTFDVQCDPDNDGCWSVYLDNGRGSGAEIAGKIHYRSLADKIASDLNSTMSQNEIEIIFRIS